MKNPDTIIEGISVPVIVLDPNLNILLANQSALALFPDIRVGEAIGTLGQPDDEFETALRAALAQGIIRSASIVTNETFQREFLVTIKPAGEAPRQTLVLTFEDQTPLRDAKSMRSDFVANVSHEIRSPLTAISGFVETLQGDASDDPGARTLFLGLMEKEVVRMTNLVTDLLSLSKVEAKERRAPTKLLDLRQTLRQSVELVTGLAGKREKRLEVQIAPDLPAVLGKADHLSRVFINLLENAINYSCEASRIRLTAEAAPATNPLGCAAVRIAVQDEGDGIPAKEIPRLTERFYRVDKSRSRNMGGTGLGLAIVKHILVRHRGSLVIDSTVGEGSTFTVYLPAAPQQ